MGFRLTVGGLGIELLSREPAILSHLERRYGPYRNDAPSTAWLELATGHPYDPVTACTVSWQDTGGEYSATSGALSASFATATRRGRAILTADPDGLPSALDNTVRGIGARLLAGAGQLLAHGCGIIVDGGLHLFYGPSGVGKTTLARLGAAAGRPVAGDDLIVIDPQTGRGCGSPFWGDGADLPAAQGWWPLAGCWRLQQAEHAARTRLDGAAAVAELLCQVPLPAEFLPQLLGQVAAITATIPQYRLALPLPKTWSDVWEVASGHQ